MAGKKRLLLIDNDREFVEAARAALEDQGFEVLYAHSAREGWDMVLFEQPDLVISEVMLEQHDTGFTLTRQIKGDVRFKHLPVLLLTSLKEKTGHSFDFEKDGYWMKADDYAEKPLPVPDLVSRINRLLGSGSGTPSP